MAAVKRRPAGGTMGRANPKNIDALEAAGMLTKAEATRARKRAKEVEAKKKQK